MRGSTPVPEHPRGAGVFSGLAQARGDTCRAGTSHRIPPTPRPPHPGPDPLGSCQKRGRGQWRRRFSSFHQPDLKHGSRPSVRLSALHRQGQSPSVKITSRGGREQKLGWEGNKIQVSSSSSSSSSGENVSAWHERGVSEPSTTLTSPRSLSPRDQELIHSAGI